MAGENPPEFKFDGDEQESESFYHEELKDLRIEKLSQRVTLLSILLPCLTAVVIYFGYQNLSGTVNRNHDAESREIQRLAQELEDLTKNFNQKLVTFSTTLSTQDKDFGASIEGRLLALNKDFIGLQNKLKSLNDEIKRDLKQNQDEIENLKTSKVEKKSQAVAVERINTAIKPLAEELQKLKTIRQDLKTVSVDINKLETKLAQNLDTVTAQIEQVGQNYKQLAASLTKLSSNTVDTDALALEIFKIKKNFQSQLSEEVLNLNLRLNSILKDIDGIDKISSTQKKTLQKVSPESITQLPDSTQNIGSDSVKPPISSKTITEKDLIE